MNAATLNLDKNSAVCFLLQQFWNFELYTHLCRVLTPCKDRGGKFYRRCIDKMVCHNEIISIFNNKLESLHRLFSTYQADLQSRQAPGSGFRQMIDAELHQFFRHRIARIIPSHLVVIILLCFFHFFMVQRRFRQCAIACRLEKPGRKSVIFG